MMPDLKYLQLPNRSCLLFLIVLMSTTAFSQIPTSFEPKTKTEKELVQLTKLISLASEQADAFTYEKYLDKHFLITYSRCRENSYGKFADKATVITRWTKKDSSAHSTPTVYQVQVSGKTAIIHSYILDEWIEDGKKISSASWATDVWVKRKKQWHWLSSHESILF